VLTRKLDQTSSQKFNGLYKTCVEESSLANKTNQKRSKGDQTNLWGIFQQ